MKQDPCRFCRLFAFSLVPIAALLGALLGLQLALEPTRPDATKASVVLLSALRALAPAANGSALMIALVLWAFPLPLSALAADLARVSKRALLVSGPGFLVAFVLSASVCAALHGLSGGGRAADVVSALPALPLKSFAYGLFATLVDAALILGFAWRFLARVKASRMSLPAMLVLSWTVMFPLRVTLGLVLESVLPG